MSDHVTIGVTNLARSRAFYDAALAPLGIAVMSGEGEGFAGYGDGQKAFFSCCKKTRCLFLPMSSCATLARVV